MQIQLSKTLSTDYDWHDKQTQKEKTKLKTKLSVNSYLFQVTLL